MEFERSLFRIHERLLQSHTSKKVISFCFSFFFIAGKKSVPRLLPFTIPFVAIFSAIKFVIFHKQYVNSGSILGPAVEWQLLNGTSLQYSPTNGSLIFPSFDDTSNKESNETAPVNNIDRDSQDLDNQEIKEKATGSNNKTVLSRDDLFTIIVVKSNNYGAILKSLNKQKLLNQSQIQDSQKFASYYYTSDKGIFFMRQSAEKEKHNVREHLVVLTLDDISKSFFIRFQLGWNYDFDVIMVNQILFTFARQEGLLYRNDTRESWFWSTSDYAAQIPNVKFDYEGSTSSFIGALIFQKLLLVVQAVASFGLVSVINGLLIRVAIFCSSIAIFPFLMCASSRHNTNRLTRFQIAQIYRAMPHIGAEAAYLDRRSSSKVDLIFAFFWCLITFYFMYASCYFLWSVMIFPSIFSRGINDIYFFYVNIVEFMSLLFIRTRSSIKYFPKLITLINVWYIFYINSYIYGAFYEAYSFVFQITALLLFGFMKYFEQPAMTEWNPFGSYTPGINNPRTGYQLVMPSNFVLGFNFWSAFYPLHFRDTFTQEEQQSYDQLSQDENLPINFDPQPRSQHLELNTQRREVPPVERDLENQTDMSVLGMSENVRLNNSRQIDNSESPNRQPGSSEIEMQSRQ